MPRTRWMRRLLGAAAALMTLALLAEAGPASAQLAPPPESAARQLAPDDAAGEVGDAADADLNDVAGPSEQLRDATQRVTELSAQAQAAADDYASATAARNRALDVADDARSRSAAAAARADEARAQLGDYAATAYIRGGVPADLSAALDAGTPSEALTRRNTLDAVGGNSADLVRVLRDAEAAAAAALAEAQEQAALAARAEEDARDAAAAAQTAQAEAEALLASLVDTEVRAQRQAMVRARVAAFAVDGEAAVDPNGIPLELLEYGNGRIPADALSPIAGFPGHRLWEPAARSFEQLVAAAAADGVVIAVTDSYRPYEVQVRLAEQKGLYSEGGLAATPGTSDHGWGLSVDLVLGASAQEWMRTRAGAFGYVEDVPREPWHWTYYGTPAP